MNDTEKNLKLGLEYLAAGDHQNAYQVLLPLAEENIPEAQAGIGFMCQVGLGTDRNISDAFKWLESAAKHGIGEAAHNLGTLYLTCEPVKPRGSEKSHYWYNKAKELGFVTGSDDWYD